MDQQHFQLSNPQSCHSTNNTPLMHTHYNVSPFSQPPPTIPFDPRSIMGPPPIPIMAPIPDMAKLTEHALSATALERLQLPQDKITETGIIPNNPYYRLPAGLMVPLVPASRNEYKPINPRDLRLPFPKFPDENFLRMIDSYYANDADGRDSDGWDQKFIDIYLKQKEALSKMQSENDR